MITKCLFVHYLTKSKNEVMYKEMSKSKGLLQESSLLEGRNLSRLQEQFLCLRVKMCPANFPLVGSKMSALITSIQFKAQGSHLFFLLCLN